MAYVICYAWYVRDILIYATRRSAAFIGRTTSWWAPLIKAHLASHMPGNEDLTPRRVLSVCSGIFAEGEVLKATMSLCFSVVSRSIIYYVRIYDI